MVGYPRSATSQENNRIANRERYAKQMRKKEASRKSSAKHRAKMNEEAKDLVEDLPSRVIGDYPPVTPRRISTPFPSTPLTRQQRPQATPSSRRVLHDLVNTPLELHTPQQKAFIMHSHGAQRAEQVRDLALDEQDRAHDAYECAIERNNILKQMSSNCDKDLDEMKEYMSERKAKRDERTAHDQARLASIDKREAARDLFAASAKKAEKANVVYIQEYNKASASAQAIESGDVGSAQAIESGDVGCDPRPPSYWSSVFSFGTTDNKSSKAQPSPSEDVKLQAISFWQDGSEGSEGPKPPPAIGDRKQEAILGLQDVNYSWEQDDEQLLTGAEVQGVDNADPLDRLAGHGTVLSPIIAREETRTATESPRSSQMRTMIQTLANNIFDSGGKDPARALTKTVSTKGLKGGAKYLQALLDKGVKMGLIQEVNGGRYPKYYCLKKTFGEGD